MSSFTDGVSLSPLFATVIFALGCILGANYRRVWKTEGPRWQLWLFGGGAAAALLSLALLPLDYGG